jgi:hypothetical protein
VQDKDSIKNWGLVGNLKKAYDRSVKGYILVSDNNSKMMMPKDNRKQDLCLLQPYLLLQCKILNKKQFHMEIAFSDQTGNKKRLVFYGSTPYAYSRDNIAKQPMHARIPSNMILEGVWLNLQFDISSFVGKCFEGSQLNAIESISINGPCLVRRVCTCKA